MPRFLWTVLFAMLAFGCGSAPRDTVRSDGRGEGEAKLELPQGTPRTAPAPDGPRQPRRALASLPESRPDPGL